MLAVLSVSLPVREAEPACNDNYISCLSRIQYGNELGQMLVNSNDYIYCILCVSHFSKSCTKIISFILCTNTIEELLYIT
jgi:hypothetical protein